MRNLGALLLAAGVLGPFAASAGEGFSQADCLWLMQTMTAYSGRSPFAAAGSNASQEQLAAVEKENQAAVYRNNQAELKEAAAQKLYDENNCSAMFSDVASAFEKKVKSLKKK